MTREAIAAIYELENIGVEILKLSPVYETEPMYNFNQDNFYNKVIFAETSLNLDLFLKSIKNIELEMGRDLNAERNSERKIDIDILSIGELFFEKPHLNIPHPLLTERLFVLKPWNDIAPNYLVPKINLTVNSLYENLIEIDNLKLVIEEEVSV